MIAIIAILASILFPVFARGRDNARRSSCQSNMKQLGLGFLQYTQDYDEKFPQGTYDYGMGAVSDNVTWDMVLQPYLKSSQILECPSDSVSTESNLSSVPGYSNKSRRSYATAGYLSDGPSLSGIKAPALTLMAVERQRPRATAAKYWFYYNGADTVGGNLCNGGDDSDYAQPWRHLGTSNFLYTAGHVKALPGGESSFPRLTGHPDYRTSSANPKPVTWVKDSGDLPE